MAAGTQDLELFVRDALSKGASKQSIEAALVAAGWPPEQLRGALGTYADIDFPVPVPRPQPYLSAREGFLYLVLFATLGMMLLVSAGSLVMVYLGLEMLALCSYALVAVDRDSPLASESAIK